MQPDVNPFALDTPPAPAPATAVAVQSQPSPAPQQFAAPAAPAAAQQFGDDPFSGPAPQSERPRVLDLFGRLLLIVPVKVEIVKNTLSKEPGATQERMTADVVVLDGGQLSFGGNPEKLGGAPHTKVAPVPMKIDRLYMSQAGLVSQCRVALARRQSGQPGGMVLGRLSVGQAKEAGQNAPYLLTEATEADKAIARQYLANVDPFA
jgi:hypothetical protein